MLSKGCWTPVTRFRVDRSEAENRERPAAPGELWQAVDLAPDGSAFTVILNGQFAARCAGR